jgi:cytochrome c oxidase assembly protein subunit 15
MNNPLFSWSKWALLSVYLVILAGAVVRMTGSGMGCPDWPKCFGYLIPPTERSQLDWKPEKNYERGNVIILDNTLLVATQTFQSGLTIDPQNWEAYTKHDYTTFNATHTWVEFINRLLGAISGLIVLALFIRSLWWVRKHPILPLFSFFAVVGMGVQAWLGKTVVDSNLLPSKISLHMIMALLIVSVLLFVRAKSHGKQLQQPSKTLFILISVSFVLTLVQFGLGVDVRQFIDYQIKQAGYNAPQLWLDRPEVSFYVHRSLSLIVVVLSVWIYRQVIKEGIALKYIQFIIGCILVEIALGILMYYIDFPWGTQPLHLLIATLLFSAQLYWLLRIKLKPYDLSI